MSNPVFTKSFKAPTEIAGRTVVTFGGNNGEVTEASAATDDLIGISEQIGSRGNDRLDVIMLGIGEVISGGNITRGAALTVDANGHVISASLATDRIIGLAMQSAVIGDIIECLIAHG